MTASERQDEGHAQELGDAEEPELRHRASPTRRRGRRGRRAWPARRQGAQGRPPVSSAAATPQGTKRFARSVKKTSSFVAAAHSIRARYRPEYSSTMASWIIVSSRCVAGLSTGSRPVSARVTMKSAAKARRCPGLSGDARARRACALDDPPQVRGPRARGPAAKMASAMVGSARAATVTSRLAPMPPNARARDRGRPARGRTCPSRSRYTRTTRSPTRRRAGARREHRHQGGHRDRAREDDEGRGPEEPGGVRRRPRPPSRRASAARDRAARRRAPAGSGGAPSASG